MAGLVYDCDQIVVVDESLQGLREAVRADQNLLPPILEAVKTRATLGEITAVLRESYGVYTENINL